MNKFLLILVTSLLVVSSLFGKDYKQYPFKIIGMVKADTGTVSLLFFKEYMPNKVKVLDASIKNNKFSFSGYIPEPQYVMLVIKDRYYSSYFILDKGLQDITINIDSGREVPEVKNKYMLNDYPRYQAFSKTISQKRDRYDHRRDSLTKQYQNNLPQDIQIQLDKEIKDIYRQSDKLLYDYSIKYPTSRYAFWRLVNLMNWGYEPLWDSVYHAFSGELRNSYAGRVLAKKLEIGRQLAIGSMFPAIPCIDRENTKFSNSIFLNPKITLVDFWYTGCGVCKYQFKKLKEIHDSFHKKGFEIIGISIDKESDKKLWEKDIEKYKLPWLQYWDKNGVNTKKLSIGVFPTNFLIDTSGKIIEKNISLEKLEKLLSEKLK